MGSRGNVVRCPTCHKFGSKSLGGYCKVCVPKEEPKVEQKQGMARHLTEAYKPNYGTHQGGFFKDSYGIMNEGYPINRR